MTGPQKLTLLAFGNGKQSLPSAHLALVKRSVLHLQSDGDMLGQMLEQTSHNEVGLGSVPGLL